jgi:hypothetical protein
MSDPLCACGCGQPVERQTRTRFGRQAGGPRRYRQGHAVAPPRLEPVDAPRTGLCGCGCGQETPLAAKTDQRVGNVKGQPQRFVLGHVRRSGGTQPAFRCLRCGYTWGKRGAPLPVRCVRASCRSPYWNQRRGPEGSAIASTASRDNSIRNGG